MINFNCSKSLILKVYFTSTNLLFTLTNIRGKVVAWTSTGTWKVRGAKKLTSVTVETAFKKISKELNRLNCKFLHVELFGFNKNKKAVTRLLKGNLIAIKSISDKTAHPHNGCRQKKLRRI
uniref:Ribosomal protein S11 n=1 Tax=Gelidiella flabella TaxID=2026927 RepID=A0A7G9IW80_9FLOR|nr:ribosomal protein S11 [Gelidiella flabella]QNM39624.1 ribosomal protein S11 [Gelidiella flabella]